MKKKLFAKDLDRKQGLDVIWKNTNKDFKGKYEDKRYILTGGGMTFLFDMDDDIYSTELSKALGRENRSRCREIGIDLFKKHGVENLDKGFINQWFVSFRDMEKVPFMLEPGKMSAKQFTDLCNDIDKSEKIIIRIFKFLSTGKGKRLSLPIWM